MAKNVFVRTSKPHAPEGLEEPHSGCAVKDGRACFRIGERGLFDRRVNRSRLVRAGVSTVDANTTLSLLDNPEERSKKKTVDEVNHEAREMDVKGLVFFFGKLRFHRFDVVLSAWMIIVSLARQNRREGAGIVAEKRDALSEDAIGAVEVRKVKAVWWGKRNMCVNVGKCRRPVTISIRVFTALPMHEIAVNEVKT